jgi:anti-sigma factor RsiW
MSAYLDQELPTGGRGRLERHVRECAECRRRLAGLRATLTALHALPAPSGGTDPRQIAASVRVQLREPPRAG